MPRPDEDSADDRSDRETHQDEALRSDAARAAETAARRIAEQEEEDKRRSAGRGAGDFGNPAHAELGANIRPDVVEAPGGLVTITTQKSATYHLEHDDAPDPAVGNAGVPPSPEPGPEPGPQPQPPESPQGHILDQSYMLVSDEERPAAGYVGMARQGESVAVDPAAALEPLPKPTLTLALIEQNPWNAVELPLPENAQPELLQATHKAASYCAEINDLLLREAGQGNYSEDPLNDSPEGNKRHEGWWHATQRVEAIEVLSHTQFPELFPEGRPFPSDEVFFYTPDPESAPTWFNPLHDRIESEPGYPGQAPAQGEPERDAEPQQSAEVAPAPAHQEDHDYDPRAEYIAANPHFVADFERGMEFLDRLDERIQSQPAHDPDFLETPLDHLRSDIWATHNEPHTEPRVAGIGAELREGTGFTQWAETQRLASDVLPPLSRVEPDHAVDEYFQVVHGAPAPDYVSLLEARLEAAGLSADAPSPELAPELSQSDEPSYRDLLLARIHDQGNNESAQRQNEERMARNGEVVSGAPLSPQADYISMLETRLAKEEAADHDDGEKNFEHALTHARQHASAGRDIF